MELSAEVRRVVTALDDDGKAIALSGDDKIQHSMNISTRGSSV